MYTAAAAMKFRYDTRMFIDDQVKLITDILCKIFCWRHMKVGAVSFNGNTSIIILL